jgi:hypothetical protein
MTLSNHSRLAGLDSETSRKLHPRTSVFKSLAITQHRLCPYHFRTVKAWVLGREFKNPVRADVWHVHGTCQDRLRWPTAPQSDVGLGTEHRPHVATSFPPCCPPCLTTESCQCPTCSTRPICSKSSGRDGLRRPLRSHLGARHQRRLTGTDRQPVKLRVGLFVRVPATAHHFNLVLLSHPASENICDSNGRDSSKGGGDTTKAGESPYITYLQPFTNKPR